MSQNGEKKPRRKPYEEIRKELKIINEKLDVIESNAKKERNEIVDSIDKLKKANDEKFNSLDGKLDNIVGSDKKITLESISKKINAQENQSKYTFLYILGLSLVAIAISTTKLNDYISSVWAMVALFLGYAIMISGIYVALRKKKTEA